MMRKSKIHHLDKMRELLKQMKINKCDSAQFRLMKISCQEYHSLT